MNPLLATLTLIAWSGVAVLVFFLYRIAHFYQVTSNQKTHYQLFLIPLGLLLAGGLRYAVAGELASDWIGDALHFVGGALLIVMGTLLLQMMTGGRR